MANLQLITFGTHKLIKIMPLSCGETPSLPIVMAPTPYSYGAGDLPVFSTERLIKPIDLPEDFKKSYPTVQGGDTP